MVDICKQAKVVAESVALKPDNRLCNYRRYASHVLSQSPVCWPKSLECCRPQTGQPVLPEPVVATAAVAKSAVVVVVAASAAATAFVASEAAAVVAAVSAAAAAVVVAVSAAAVVAAAAATAAVVAKFVVAATVVAAGSFAAQHLGFESTDERTQCHLCFTLPQTKIIFLYQI